MKDNLDLLNEIYSEYKEDFQEHGFHSALWEVLVNGVHAEKGSRAFVPVMVEGDMINLSLVVKGKKGYFPSPAYMTGDHDHGSAMARVKEMNRKLFFLTEEEQDELIFSTL